MNSVCALSELDLFVRPPVQTSILSSRWVEYTPKVNYDKGNTPIQLEVPGTRGEYIDLSSVMFYVRASIRNASDEILKADGENGGPINYIQNTMFKTVDVSLNDVKVSTPSEYAYRSYLEALLNFGREGKTSHLDASVWAKDNYASMEGIEGLKSTTYIGASFEWNGNTISDVKKLNAIKNLNTSTYEAAFDSHKTVNGGLWARRSRFADSTAEMYGRLHGDVFNINKLLLDDVTMKIQLAKNSDDFSLLGLKGFKIDIDEFVLCVRKVKISEQVLLAHAMALEKTTAYYPMTRVDVISRTITKGVLTEKFENMVRGPMPKRIVLGMVKNEAFVGTRATNPFNFQMFNVI